MGGLELPLLLLAWSGLCALIAHRIGDLFIDNPLRTELKAIIFLALLPVLLLDELLAKPQFEKLCAEKAVMTVHVPAVHGRSYYLTELPIEQLPGLFVPVHMQRRLYVDARTHQPLVSFTILRAGGGKLVRVLQRESATPMTFEGQCRPRNWQQAYAALGLQAAPPPAGAAEAQPLR
ncbi:hypothetical protein WG922_18750 [Ramlibacter sp. AN1015]|uniref:hypothetical protein n=1 Tax=Ramlibacter sp. AN1015 TaxID=3133428 RepID=UPI0030C05B0B